MPHLVDISPQQFWGIFCERVEAALQSGPDWHYAWRAGPKAWTNWFFPVLMTVYRHLGFRGCGSVQFECSKIDVTLWRNPDAANFLVAVEHENGWSQWLDEWRKLQSVVCALRVVIGYEKTSSLEENLHQAGEIARKTTVSLDRPSLLILFVGDEKGKPGDRFLAYHWDGKHMAPLDGAVSLPAHGCSRCGQLS